MKGDKNPYQANKQNKTKKNYGNRNNTNTSAIKIKTMKMSNRRNPYSLSDFSLRRLLLQGARAARGSPQLGTRLCDVERGSVKYDKSHPSTSGSSGSNKVMRLFTQQNV